MLRAVQHSYKVLGAIPVHLDQDAGAETRPTGVGRVQKPEHRKPTLVGHGEKMHLVGSLLEWHREGVQNATQHVSCQRSNRWCANKHPLVRPQKVVSRGLGPVRDGIPTEHVGDQAVYDEKLLLVVVPWCTRLLADEGDQVSQCGVTASTGFFKRFIQISLEAVQKRQVIHRRVGVRHSPGHT